jgi:hypothetical protein
MPRGNVWVCQQSGPLIIAASYLASYKPIHWSVTLIGRECTCRMYEITECEVHLMLMGSISGRSLLSIDCPSNVISRESDPTFQLI